MRIFITTIPNFPKMRNAISEHSQGKEEAKEN
jgi:hypothetical protein